MPLERRQFLTLGATLPVALLVGGGVLAQQKLGIYAEDGVAIDGTDAVAYFTQGAPVAGDAGITYDWMGVTWRFASAQNRDLFAADPARYAPQYGGYCAWAVSQGYTASTVPDAWEIVDGKLYLNYSRRIQRRWAKDIPGNIAKGDAQWPSVLQ